MDPTPSSMPTLRPRSLVRTVARALLRALGRTPTSPDTDGYEAWLDERFAR